MIYNDSSTFTRLIFRDSSILPGEGNAICANNAAPTIMEQGASTMQDYDAFDDSRCLNVDLAFASCIIGIGNCLAA